MRFQSYDFGAKDADIILLQLVDDHDMSLLEWNKGNHFKESDLRTARAFAWVMNRLYIS